MNLWKALAQDISRRNREFRTCMYWMFFSSEPFSVLCWWHRCYWITFPSWQKAHSRVEAQFKCYTPTTNISFVILTPVALYTFSRSASIISYINNSHWNGIIIPWTKLSEEKITPSIPALPLLASCCSGIWVHQVDVMSKGTACVYWWRYNRTKPRQAGIPLGIVRWSVFQHYAQEVWNSSSSPVPPTP
jgi:hypothetical protein